jgi:hypothetical protein
MHRAIVAVYRRVFNGNLHAAVPLRSSKIPWTQPPSIRFTEGTGGS